MGQGRRQEEGRKEEPEAWGPLGRSRSGGGSRTGLVKASSRAPSAGREAEAGSQGAGNKSGVRSQQIFIERLPRYCEEAMMLDTPVEERREEQVNMRRTGDLPPAGNHGAHNCAGAAHRKPLLGPGHLPEAV